jgi:hypothetical protein
MKKSVQSSAVETLRLEYFLRIRATISVPPDEALHLNSIAAAIPESRTAYTSSSRG